MMISRRFIFRYTLGYARSTKLDKPVIPLPQFASPESAKMHSAPNPKMERLMAVKDPLTQSVPERVRGGQADGYRLRTLHICIWACFVAISVYESYVN
jgi:hypothetical protein